MGLFNLRNNMVQIEPEILLIPEVKVLWDRDSSKDKIRAYKELSYIYFLYDFKSPYQNVDEQHRELEVKKDFLKDEKYPIDKDFQNAIDKYINLQITPSLRLLNAARGAQEKLTTFFKDKGTDDKNYTSNLEKIGKIIESIDKLEERVKKEIKTDEKIRGGGSIGDRER